MKITGIEVSLLRVPPEKAYEAGGRTVDAFWHVLARLRTEGGVEGFGYVVALRSSLVASVASASRELGATLVGMNVLEPEAAWERLHRAGDWVGPGGLLYYAIAPLDIALWDAAGKTVGQPLWRLLGGYRPRLPVYASDGFWYNLTLRQLADSAVSSARAGFTALKLRIGHEREPAAEVRRVEAVREAVGPDVRILVDATESWDVAQAMRTGKALQDAGVHWLEDPISHRNVAGLTRLADQLQIPIAAGEHLYQVDDFARLIEARAIGVALIDLGRIGGITPWRRVANLAQAYGLRVCGHVLPEVHVHLTGAAPNGYMVEHVPRSAAILEAMPAVEGGHITAPDAPGLGLRLNEAAVRDFTQPV